MIIELQKIKVREVFAGYEDTGTGVVGYSGKLDIRPPYQREFIYKPKQEEAVINTVRNGFPLNCMYWVRRADGNFELLDGQQRTLSICRFLSGAFAIDHQYAHNLRESLDDILDYELLVYICEGTDEEKLDWFRTVNIAGERLTAQEIRNAVYAGPFLTSAKWYFSNPNGQAADIASNYLKGSPIRQDYLETALDWISKGNIEDYMAKHQHDENASELWLYFQSVINWVRVVFPVVRKKVMQGVEWGPLYDKYGQARLNADTLEARIRALMCDEDVSCKAGTYTYVLTGEERHLQIRAFTDNDKRETFERQNGLCNMCSIACEIEDMQGDHIKQWCEGGKTKAENCQMLCTTCHKKLVMQRVKVSE